MLLSLLIAQLSTAQLPTATPVEPLPRSAPSQQRSSSVTGVVHDSIANRPLAGATVQLVAADTLARFGQTVISDSLGFYSFREVPEGRYTLGFFHPMLDSLGIEPMMRSITVNGSRSVLTNLAIPSAASLSAAVCGAPSRMNSAALLFGIVRDARSHEPVAGVTVAGEWVELSLGSSGVVRRTPRRVITTSEKGWFAICNVPSPGTVTLTASRSADSTDLIEVDVPVDGFLRRELYLGDARTVVVNDNVRRGDAQTTPTRAFHVGDGRLRGTVVASTNGKPLVNAQVGITNGPTTRTNERGEWTLTDAPAGTRALEVRAVGYYPARESVDVVDGAPPINFSLATFKSVLDTMKVLADYDRYSNLAGFRERRRSGVGRYLSSGDIAKRDPLVTSDLFLMLPGVYVEYLQPEDTTSAFASTGGGGTSMATERSILMRGTTTNRCIPAIYINGNWMQNIVITDIDAFMRPESLEGIEIYSATQTPPQFQPGLTGCGSIVFWRR